MYGYEGKAWKIGSTSVFTWGVYSGLEQENSHEIGGGGQHNRNLYMFSPSETGKGIPSINVATLILKCG